MVIETISETFLVLRDYEDNSYLSDWHAFGTLGTYNIHNAYRFNKDEYDTASQLAKEYPNYQVKELTLTMDISSYNKE